MAKAMLIMDMPSSCSKCPICQGIDMCGEYICSIKDEFEYEQGYYDGEYDRPNYCPLRDCPTKKEFSDIETAYDRVKTLGYNACIDEILGGGE